MIAPSHIEIYNVLRSIDEDIANFVRDNEQYCWGELLLVVQQKFSVDVITRSLFALEKKGYGKFVAHAFCPATEKLMKKFLKLDEVGIEKIRAGILGRLWVMRFDWMKTRKEWMVKCGLSNVTDESFVRTICLWLQTDKI